jgi:NADH-quinone oxidoreductase subunit H
MDVSLLIEWVIKSIIIILVMTGGFAYTTLYERKVLAAMQVRVGPNRAGPWGILQPIADGIKLIFKEDLVPAYADKFIFILAPVITVVPALVITAVIPWGTSIELGGRTIPLYLADVNVAILFIMAITSISVYGITLAGWSSNNKYAMLGGLRSTAQMISYELALGFSMVVPVMMAGSMSILDIVNAQKNIWFGMLQPAAFIIYFLSSLAEVNRAPFDMPEAEQELTAGYHTEYSSMKFALFFMAEYIKVIAVAMIGSSLFLGGFRLPFIELPPILGPVVLFGKVFIWVGVVIWMRATLPRFRYDRLMSLGWKILFPLALFNIVVTAVVYLLVGGGA